MKIGILGGTFNPIHLGHLIMAEEIRQALKLDKVIFVPTYLPPHKPARQIAAAIDRLKMLRLAVKGNPYFNVSDIEIKRKGKSYTIDTVKAFKRRFKRSKLYFIIGSDYHRTLNGWKDVKKIQRLVKFAVINRPGFPLRSLANRYVLNLNVKTLDISGYEIRERIRRKQSICYLVPREIMRYIYNRKLYKKN